MRKSGILLTAIILLTARLAWSQAHPLTESSNRRYGIFGGPVFTGSNPSGATFGAGFGVSGNFTRWVGIQGEFTFVRRSCCVVNNITLTDYMIGPRVAKPFSASSRLSPFADVLFGGQTLNNSSNHHIWTYNNGSGPAIAVDGGIDVRLTGRLALRGQFGLVHSRFTQAGGVGSVSNDRWRAGMSLAYRF